MKKVKFDKKLSLNKKVVTKLNVEQMNAVKGGKLSWFRDCSSGSICCCATI